MLLTVSSKENGFFKRFFGVFCSKLPEDKITPEHEQELKGYVSRPGSVYNHFLVEPFQLTDLDRAIGPLPRKKSPGHDCILNQHFIQGGESIKQMLLMLFNLIRFCKVHAFLTIDRQVLSFLSINARARPSQIPPVTGPFHLSLLYQNCSNN